MRQFTTMKFVPRRSQIAIGLGLIVLLASLAVLFVRGPREIIRKDLPEQLSDSEFRDLISEFSEAGGYFRSDNFVSNESAFQHVIPALKRQIKPGGVYLGVGPEQNFTYIAALRPKVAFIVDIRRQNMLLHLMYKSLFELSENRAEFVSKLFARQLMRDVPKTATAEQLFTSIADRSDPYLAQQTLESILDRLRVEHRFDLGGDDSNSIEYVYNAFVTGGPEIRYSYPNQYAWRRFPSYSELMLENDGASENGGENRSYLASEESFQTIKAMESENLIIPIVGDFGGEKALRSVGRYVRERGATVSTFYTSNVEFYLFQTDDWRKFLNTVSDFPVNNDSTFIRSYFNNYGLQFPNPPGWLYPPPQSYTLLQKMPELIAAFSAGRIRIYFDVIRYSAP
jgi:hypothetical protein